jgi:ATP-dependent RNA helicase DDX54/DBP10
LTKDELPYLLDLHLFLGRPLKPAANFTELQRQHQDHPEGSPAPTPDDGYWGRFPGSILERLTESINKFVKASHDLQTLQRSMDNSMKAYHATRAPASSESIRRAKTLVQSALHPLFLTWVNAPDVLETQQAREDLLASISSFRPPLTILEVNARQKGSSIDASVMLQKRQAHERLLERNQAPSAASEAVAAAGASEEPAAELQGATATTPGSSRAAAVASKVRLSAAEKRRLKKRGEPLSGASATAEAAPAPKKQRGPTGAVVVEPLLPTHRSEQAQHDEFREQALSLDEKRPRGGHERLEDVILDLLPDDAQDILKHQKVLRWDARKKKYVQQTGASAAPGKRYARDEGGHKIELSDKKFKPKRYAAWKAATKGAIPVEGDFEPTAAAGAGSSAKDAIPLHRRHKWHSGESSKGAAQSKSELKSPAQIRKELAKKELQKMKQQKGWKKKLAQQRKKEHERKRASLARPPRSSKSLTFVRKK